MTSDSQSLSALTMVLRQVPTLSEALAVPAASDAFRTICSRAFRTMVGNAADPDVEAFIDALSAAGQCFSRRQQAAINTWLPVVLPPSIVADTTAEDDADLIAEMARDVAAMTAMDDHADRLVDTITEALADELLDLSAAAVARLGSRRRHPSSSMGQGIWHRQAARRDEQN